MSGLPSRRPSDAQLPVQLRRPTTHPRWTWLLSNWARCLPDFLVIGAQKSGTTSLTSYLHLNPGAWVTPCKECNYLSGTSRSVGYYRAFFPTTWTRRSMERRAGRTVLIGEGTPYDLFHPRAPRRAATVVPQARFIVLLRDPVERAFSHYRHCVRLGIENLSFPDAIAAESERTHGEEKRLDSNDSAESDYHRHYSYVARGRYAEQLERWRSYIDPKQIHVEIAENLFQSPDQVLNRIENFLGLEPRHGAGFELKNKGIEKGSIPEKTARELRSRYAEANADLEKLLGTRLPWES